MEHPIDTLNKAWREEQADRFLSWELFTRGVLHADDQPLNAGDLCDRIGVQKNYVRDVITGIRDRMNE